MPSSSKRLLIESVVALALARVALALLPFRLVRRFAGDEHQAREPTPDATSEATRVGWAIPIASRRFPVPMTCLVQAVAAAAMLRRRRCRPVLRIGVAPASGTIKAHAWVECAGIVVVGEVEQLEQYSVLSPSR